MIEGKCDQSVIEVPFCRSKYQLSVRKNRYSCFRYVYSKSINPAGQQISHLSALSLRFLGVGNTQATELRSSAAVLENHDEPILLIDCGPDTLYRFRQRYGDIEPNALFILHMPILIILVDWRVASIHWRQARLIENQNYTFLSHLQFSCISSEQHDKSELNWIISLFKLLNRYNGLQPVIQSSWRQQSNG